MASEGVILEGEQPNSGSGIERPRFTTEYMDTTADPRRDFYDYATGRWLRTRQIPPDKSVWGSFTELDEWNLYALHQIVKECAADKGAKPGSYSQMVGDFYASAIGTELIERLRFSPIEEMWEEIDGVTSIDEVLRIVPILHMHGVSVFFDADPSADIKNSSVYALYFSQGGISLPDRDYYMKAQFADVLSGYKAHVKRMFMLKGIAEPSAAKRADTVLDIETEMAMRSRPQEDLRDIEKNYTRVETAQLDGKYKRLSLTRYMEGLGVPQVDYIVVMQPEFMDWLDGQLQSRPVDEWKVYMWWKLLHAYAPLLHSDVEMENFEFFRRQLTGQKEKEARWKKAVHNIDAMIGEALGKLYVDRYFTEESRRKAIEMVNDLIEVFRDRLAKLEWMSPATRQKALEKLSMFNVKIGHPDKFRDYTGLVIKPDDYAGNVMRAVMFEMRREISRIGGPVDKSEWEMTPPEVNAYYEPQNNEIVFPAGIFQPSFFDAKMDYAVNYGGLGAVIGHEITHGFDDQGRKYDGAGNLSDWWSPDDLKRFTEKTDAIVEVYSEQEEFPGMHINGKLTLGENIADIGGVSIAYEALQRRLARDPSGIKTIDGLTQEQRFFIAYGQVWRRLAKDEVRKMLLTVDPHSPAKYRAEIPARSEPAFDAAFPAKQGEADNGAARLGVW